MRSRTPYSPRTRIERETQRGHVSRRRLITAPCAREALRECARGRLPARQPQCLQQRVPARLCFHLCTNSSGAPSAKCVRVCTKAWRSGHDEPASALTGLWWRDATFCLPAFALADLNGAIKPNPLDKSCVCQRTTRIDASRCHPTNAHKDFDWSASALKLEGASCADGHAWSSNFQPSLPQRSQHGSRQTLP